MENCFKPLLSDKSINSEKIHLNENGELIDGESKTAEVLDEFFSKIVKILKIPEYENLNPNFEYVKGPVFKAILKPPKYHCDKRQIKTQNLPFMKLTMKKL